ncbi:hypothetical protein EXW39_28575 (plasmid) [Bacillus mycoides]|nr:hypothetical protein EXW39_28575 [Bacillus mycoides]
MKVARTVRIGGKVEDNIKDLPIDNNLKNFLNENLFIKYSLYIILGAGLIRTGYEFGYFITNFML